MLILADRQDHPDHPYPEIDRRRKYEDDHISATCRYSWWFGCSHVTKQGKTKIPCTRVHRVSCDGGMHIPLDLAEVALRQAGWHRVSNRDDGGWRCSAH
jgi:hypothetical protein